MLSSFTPLIDAKSFYTLKTPTATGYMKHAFLKVPLLFSLTPIIPYNFNFLIYVFYKILYIKVICNTCLFSNTKTTLYNLKCVFGADTYQ